MTTGKGLGLPKGTDKTLTFWVTRSATGQQLEYVHSGHRFTGSHTDIFLEMDDSELRLKASERQLDRSDFGSLTDLYENAPNS